MDRIILLYLGAVIAVLIKLNNYKNQYELANEVFLLKKYLQKDWINLILAFICPVAFFYLVPEATSNIESLKRWIMACYLITGGIGPYIILSLFSGARQYIKKKIDLKTNIADAKLPDTNIQP